jgi:hypothetical protein
LTQFFNWRATFWFMVIFAGLNLLSFVFIFKDTFRRERSLTYQQVLHRLEQERSASTTSSKRASQVTLGTPSPSKKASQGDSTPTTDETQGIELRDMERGDPRQEPSQRMDDITLSLKDVNPVGPVLVVLRRMNNFTMLFASGRCSRYVRQFKIAYLTANNYS